MSLNGLDASAVQDAYQTVIAEPGGWFLLKYANRDSVELLGRGKSGVHETRNAIAQYTEASPLYGLIIYRRRRVLIKYMPEGVSRVLKARTAVHLQDVQERYSPYDTMLEIATADGLNDTALAASFPLHTASTSSVPKLGEISEDAEAGDGGLAPRLPPTQLKSSLGPERYKRDRKADPVMRSDVKAEPTMEVNSLPPSIQLNGLASPLTSPLASPNKTSVTQFLVRDELGKRSVTSLGTPSISSVTEYASSEASAKDTESIPSSTTELPHVVSSRSPASPRSPPSKPAASPLLPPASPPRRGDDSLDSQRSSPEVRVPTGFQERLDRLHELQHDQELVEQPGSPERISASRPSTTFDSDDPYDLKKFDYLLKPKVKLGPRPLAAPEIAKRTQTASVAALPANVRPPPKKEQSSRSTTRPTNPTLSMTSITRSSMVASTLSNSKALPAPPPIPDTPEYNPRPLSRGSIKSLPSHKSTAMTPDKLRLMKAVELRKKQLRKSATAAQLKPLMLDSDIPDVPVRLEQPAQPVWEDEPAKETTAQASQRYVNELASSKVDSGIEMDYDKATKQKNAASPDSDAVLPTSKVEESRSVNALSQAPTITCDTTKDNDQTSEAGTPTMPPNANLARPQTPAGQSTVGTSTSQTPKQEKKLDENSPRPSANGSIPIPTIVGPTISRGERDASMEEVNPDLESSAFSLDMILPDHNLKTQSSDLARRRRGFVQPLHLDGEESASDDDGFMDELHTATLQQAKPMTVSKSPVTAHFTRRPSNNSLVSDLLTEAKALPASPTKTQMPSEAAVTHDHARTDSPPSVEKPDSMANLRRNVSSGISKRIQALTDVSTREPTRDHVAPSRSRETSPHALPQRERVERQNSRDSSRGPALRSRTSSYQRAARLSARLSTGQGQSSAPVAQIGNSPMWTVQQDVGGNRHSVSVSARIIRPTAPAADEQHPTSPANVELHPSPLVVNQTRAAAPATTFDTTPLIRLDSNTRSQPPSGSDSIRSVSPVLNRQSVEGGATKASQFTAGSSISRHSKPVTPSAISATPDDFPTPLLTRSSSIDESSASTATPKESSRTSRFLKRMSNIGGSKRKSTVPQPLNGATAEPATRVPPIVPPKDRNDMPPPVIVGDLNVQFPDTLLWKRRVLEIDSTGHLNFFLTQQTERQRGAAAKCYALADFRQPPYIPDLDRQELAHSVLLEFGDGRTLQAACEDAAAQRQVVRLLGSYWKAWAA